jgi:short-subunit dehydrogenase
MKLQRMIVLGFAAGLAGAVAINNRLERGRVFLPLRPGRADTALVTGASSGIGAEFARQLAAGGYRVMLVARREERLAALQVELRERYGMESDFLVADLSSEDGIAQVAERIRAMDDLTILVNNAGFGTVGRLFKADPERQAEMVRVHVQATAALSQAALPTMVEQARGAIINVSSIAAFARMPGNVNYCATKAYINAFSESLANELRGTGVQVQALCPGYTITEFHDTNEYARFDRSSSPDFLWLSARDVVSQSLHALERDEVIFVPGVLYRIGTSVLSLPGVGSMASRLAARVLK